MTKKFIFFIYALIALFTCAQAQRLSPIRKKVAVAYVTSWTRVIPDPTCVTHINYAFGHFNNTFNGIPLDNAEILKQLVALKAQHPALRVLLSIGGWGSGCYSEMVSADSSRNAFANDCLRVISEFGLDGIDIDWEYPTSSSAKISASPDDTGNYTKMMTAIRKAIGRRKLLTLASVAGAHFIDYKAIVPYVDFVNVMTYDMASAPHHQAGLFRSANTGGISVDEGIQAHLKAGIPPSKLVLGIPFYGHGNRDDIPGFIDYREILKLPLASFNRRWDDSAKAPFIANNKGEFICTFEDPASVYLKCNYILQHDLLGAMYWEYAGDTDEGTLRKAVYHGLNIY